MRRTALAFAVSVLLLACGTLANEAPMPRPKPTTQPATQPNPPRTAMQRVGEMAIGAGVAALVAVGGLSLLRRR